MPVSSSSTCRPARSVTGMATPPTSSSPVTRCSLMRRRATARRNLPSRRCNTCRLSFIRASGPEALVRQRRQIGAPLSPTRCRRHAICASGRLPAVFTCSYRAGRFHREPDGLLLLHLGFDGASTVIVPTTAAAFGGRSGLASSNRQIDLCIANLCSAVDLHQLLMRPLHCVLRWHPLHRLRVHIDNDIFGDHLGRAAARWSGIARQSPIVRYISERQQHRVDIPHRVLLPILCRAVGIALLGRKPLSKDLL